MSTTIEIARVTVTPQMQDLLSLVTAYVGKSVAFGPDWAKIELSPCPDEIRRDLLHLVTAITRGSLRRSDVHAELGVIASKLLATGPTTAAATVHADLPAAGFPRFWQLFPIILPRSVREKVYEPCHEELKEDYLKERARWTGKWTRRWVTLCFTVRTAGLVAQSLWAAAGGTARKLTLAAVALVLGERAVAVLREKIVEWLGRLP
jgi:hypothetical protein